MPEASDASAQRSIASADGSFCLFSEAASLPRLMDTDGPEMLAVAGARSGEVVPRPGPHGAIALPRSEDPPLFVLLGAQAAAKRSAGKIKLAYYLDDPTKVAMLPSIDTVLRGLEWLSSLAPAVRNLVFSDVWLGLPPDASSAGGATGSGLIRVNYLRAAPADPLKAAAIEAVPLIEATHQFGLSYGLRPQWVEESVATYFGAAALIHAQPDQSEPKRLLAKWETDAAHYSFGLLEAQRRVAQGDTAAYGAYFTKGVAFWSALDAAMRAAGNNRGLASRLPQIWTASYEHDGRPPANFSATLGLSPDDWQRLSEQFLE